MKVNTLTSASVRNNMFTYSSMTKPINSKCAASNVMLDYATNVARFDECGKTM